MQAFIVCVTVPNWYMLQHPDKFMQTYGERLRCDEAKNILGTVTQRDSGHQHEMFVALNHADGKHGCSGDSSISGS